MNQSGDAPMEQPGESVDSLSSIADLMDDDAAPEEELTLDESEGEESDESEEDAPDEEQPEDEDDAADDATFTLKVNGKDITVTKAELIELGQKGADYTAKTMAVAEERKAVEAIKAQTEQVRQQYEQTHQQALSQAQAVAQFLQTQLGQPPSIELLHTQGSDVYLAHKAEYEHRQAQLQQVMSGVEQMQGEAHRQRQAWLAQQADATEQALRDTLPGWNDDTLVNLADFGRKHGLDPASVAEAFVQKGFWEVLHKAQQFDALQERKATLKPKTELPKVNKPKASPQTPRGIVARQEAEKRYRAKPSIDSIADLID